MDAYLRDRSAGTTELVSLSSLGEQSADNCFVLVADPTGNSVLPAPIPTALSGFRLFMQGVDLDAAYPTDTFGEVVQ